MQFSKIEVVSLIKHGESRKFVFNEDCRGFLRVFFDDFDVASKKSLTQKNGV